VALLGLEQLNANLQLVKNWTNESLKTGMEVSLNLIEVSAKANHKRAKSLSPDVRKEHPDERYYTWSGQLTGSVHAEKVKVSLTGLTGEVVASEAYAIPIELGGPNRRAFPFLGPALNDNSEEIFMILGSAVKAALG